MFRIKGACTAYKPGASTKRRYRKALIEVDTAIGNLLPAIPAGTQIVAISDHGFCDWSRVDGFHHNACPQTWGITSPALPLGSRLLDVAALLRP